MNLTTSKMTIEDILVAGHLLREVIVKTPLQKNAVLSEKYNCNVFIKREDLQIVRSFKLRGAYYFMRTLSEEQLQRGVVCASAGNHAQGVAFSCQALGVKGTIFMPNTTPRQKITQVKLFGGDKVEVVLTGDTFDDSFAEATNYCNSKGMTFIHPFDNEKIIAGQGTVGMEILNDMTESLDYVFVAIGGGGLAAGVGTCIKGISPLTDVIGVEPEGAASMKLSLANKRVVPMQEIDSFVDGAAVKQVGQLTFEICEDVLDDIVTIPEGQVCSTILDLYNQNAIVAEPAGALSISALETYRDKIQGKNVVCIMSGGNNDIDRMQDIKERSLMYEGLKHYFIINFPQRAGALREFLDDVLGPTDDITRFEYTKKNNKNNGPALVGIELKQKQDYEALIERMEQKNINYMEINQNPALFNLLI
ncbi:threonine ammonia-lyase IlvA [Brevibacillus daliensis]|uniref:threonine ammonia-lyase IlvA n=1 Tax=Brevibacillus daliensis TaxID=2892995 RepID=UPI001E5E31B7|nr:threonine ammonia-lyase IlvA [Brevibacillus daliensis]